MRTRTGLLLLVMVGLAAAGIAFRQEEIADFLSEHGTPGTEEHGQQAGRKPGGLDLLSRYKTEGHWIHASVCEDIAAMIVRASGQWGVAPGSRALPTVTVERRAGSPTWDVSLEAWQAAPSLTWSFEVTDFVWSPSTYEEWARRLLTHLSAEAPYQTAPSNHDVMAALTDCSVESVESQNKAVSRWLQEHPLDPQAHEAAGLVLAVMGLREASGTFSDTRWAMNRLSAHLAVARALRGSDGLGSDGRIADIALRVLVGRQAEAQTKLDELKRRTSLSSPETCWHNILSLRNRSDWRMFEACAGGTLLERIEYFRSVATNLNAARAMELIEREETRTSIPDWSRLLVGSPSVGIGHFATNVVQSATMREISEIYRLRRGTSPTGDAVVAFLNVPPGGAVDHPDGSDAEFQVVDDGAWGRFEQRHICAIAERIEGFMRDMLAVDEAAEEFRRQMDPLLSQLAYFPIVQKLRAQNQQEYEEGMNASAGLVREHPELVSDRNWLLLRNTTKFKFVHVIPYYEGWFTPVVLPGTTFRTDIRIGFPSIWKGPPSQLEPFMKLAPNDPWIARRYVEIANNEKPTAEQYRQSLAPFLEYHIGSMDVLAHATGDLDEYVRIMERLCKYRPDSYFALGVRLADAHRDDEAAEAYRKGIEKGDDRVNAANLSEWLVNYYYDHGRKEEAMALARQAAGVYSYYGLMTLMRLFERMDRIEDAERIALQIERRYDSVSDRAGLYYRHLLKMDDPTYRKKFDEIIASTFPRGMEKVTLDSFTSPPRDGLMVYGESMKSKEVGVRDRAVIVAVDGIRVHNEEQYLVARDLSYSEEMTLIVWQGGRFEEISGQFWRRLLGVQTIDYKAS